jgi:hypothetical protein
MRDFLFVTFLTIFIFALIGTVVSVLNKWNSEDLLKCPLKTIVEIGGCNRYACGIKYNDGTFGSRSQPVVGMQVRVCD